MLTGCPIFFHMRCMVSLERSNTPPELPACWPWSCQTTCALNAPPERYSSINQVSRFKPHVPSFTFQASCFKFYVPSLMFQVSRFKSLSCRISIEIFAPVWARNFFLVGAQIFVSQIDVAKVRQRHCGSRMFSQKKIFFLANFIAPEHERQPFQ